jgi:hypothetical protein
MPSIINASSSGSGGIVQTADASGVLQLQTNGTTAVNVDTSARVGVGLTTLTEKFEVNGSINASTSSSNNFSTGSARAIMDYVPGSNTARFGQINGASGLTTGKLALYNNGLESVAIDTVGRMTRPYQTLFLASINGIPSSTAAGIVPYDVVTTNVGSNFNTSTYTFTAPVAGNYMFTYGIRVDGFTTGNYFHFRPLKNNATNTAGSGWYGGDYINYSSNTSFVGAYATFTLNLAANDTIKLRNDCSISAGTYLGYQSWFNGYLLG